MMLMVNDHVLLFDWPCASSLVNAGTSIYVVGRALGHTQIKNTMRYSHLSQETLLDATEKVAEALGV